MNMFAKIAVFGVAMAASGAFATDYTRMAECSGRTQRGAASRAVIFVNKDADTTGMVMVTIANEGDYLSKTKVSWNSSGHPRFYDNDFDLDLVIEQSGVSQDDALVKDTFIPELSCEYAP